MGWTSENVGADFALTRDEMDDFAAKSYQKAEHAQKAGYFDAEIVPFTAYKKDATGNREQVIITKDDGIRYGTTKESLGKIRAAFPQWGNSLTTGGNASQITDGAAAVLLMTRRKAQELGLTVLGKHVTTAVAGNYVCYARWATSAHLSYRCCTSCYGYRAPLGNPHGSQEHRSDTGRCRFVRGKSLVARDSTNPFTLLKDQRSLCIASGLLCKRARH